MNGKLERWNEYFEEILNPKGNKNSISGNIQRHEETNVTENKGIKANPPSKAETFKALKDLKLGKAAGLDTSNPEILKVDLDATATALLPLFVHIWAAEKMPDDLKDG
jgi:hypothetical protein